MAESAAVPSNEYSESVRELGLAPPGKQERAAALASTTGKCFGRESTTSIASRAASKAVSVNGRVASLAKRKNSGDVAIRWTPVQPQSDR
jgi:hypothetical protein